MQLELFSQATRGSRKDSEVFFFNKYHLQVFDQLNSSIQKNIDTALNAHLESIPTVSKFQKRTI